MAKAAYWQRGESLDYLNETTAVIEANTVIALSGRIGVAGTSINPGEKGSLHVTGVYEIAKTGTDAIAMGETVYFDGKLLVVYGIVLVVSKRYFDRVIIINHADLGASPLSVI